MLNGANRGELNMNRKELVLKVVEKTGKTQKEVSEFLDGFLTILEEAVDSKEPVSVVGYFSIGYKDELEKVINSPITKGKDVVIQAHIKTKIKLGSKLAKR